MVLSGRFTKIVTLACALVFSGVAHGDEGFTWFGEKADGNWLAGVKLSSVTSGKSGYDTAVNGGIVLGYQFSRPIGLTGTSTLEFEFTNSLDNGSVSNDAGFGVNGEWSTENLGMYFAYRTTGSVYFVGRFGLLKSDVETTLDGLNTFSDDDTAFSYGAGLGIHLGEKGNFNLELELVGASGTNDLNQVTLGGIWLFE